MRDYIKENQELRAALIKLLKEHDIMSQCDPSIRVGGDRWPDAAKEARKALRIPEDQYLVYVK